MENCIFCKIIKGEIPSKTVYEDETTIVFMSIDPATDGHLLVVPKKHIVTIMDMDMDTLSHMVTIIREKMYPLLKEKLNCEGLTIGQNNDLGQEVKHFHIHLIPRYEGDNADVKYDHTKVSPIEEVFEKLQ